MKSYVPFLIHQIARYGATTAPQLESLLVEKRSRATLYRALKKLLEMRVIRRMIHPSKPIIAFIPTPLAYSLVYGPDHQRHCGVKPDELYHALCCTDAIITLSRYTCVSGIATEYEVDPDDIKEFSFSRIPDGIIQITRDQQSFELAVEVETTLKREQAIEQVLQNYARTLSRNMLCRGVMIVAQAPEIYAKYQSLISKLPQDVEKQILLTTPEGLQRLSPKFFGTQVSGPAPSWDLLRTQSQGVVEYVSVKSTSYEVLLRPNAPHGERRSGILDTDIL